MESEKQQRTKHIWKRILLAATALWALALLCFVINCVIVFWGMEHQTLYEVRKADFLEAFWITASLLMYPFGSSLEPMNHLLIGMSAGAVMIYWGMKKFLPQKLHLRYGFTLAALITIPSFYSLCIFVLMLQ